MSMDNKVPDIRFKGFSGEWEEKGLGTDVAEIIGGGTPSTSISEFWNGDIDWYSPTEIGSNVYAEGSQKKITDLGLKSSSAKILPAGNTILFTSRAGIGDMAILAKPGATNQGFQSFVVKEGFSPYFLYSAGKQIKEFALKHASGSTFLEISGKQLGCMKIRIPCSEEQTTIGNYFQKLDMLISQHQQKHDKLNNIKKAMLEKMFPKPSETIPEIRFKGFSGEWEEEYLGDMVTCFSGGTPLVGVEEYYSGNIPFIRSAEINKTTTELTISESGLKNSSAKIVKVGTVLYALYGATSGEVGRARILGAINQAILAIVPKGEICPEFLAQWLRKSKMNIVNTYLQGGQGNLSGEIVKNLILKIPGFKEQTAIGNYFQKLDTLINQHQQQITKLNNIKQACLSKMFV